MNGTDKSLSDAVRDSIHRTTPGGFRPRYSIGAWLFAYAVVLCCAFAGILLLAWLGHKP